MYLMYCDETNLEEESGIFFVYGGIIVEESKALSLSKAIDNIRSEYSIDNDFYLKFNPGPKGMEHKDFISLKQSIIEIAIEHECKLIVSMILHDIATCPNDARLNEINRICYHFNCFLNRPNSHGLVLIDRFSGKEIDHHLRTKFSVGVTGLPYTPEMRLDNIIGFHYTTIGQSHLCSIVDIALGSFRFAINAWSKEIEKIKGTSKTLLELLAPLFYHESGHKSVSEIGLFFSPKAIKAQRYYEKYNGLRDYLKSCGITPEQEIERG